MDLAYSNLKLVNLRLAELGLREISTAEVAALDADARLRMQRNLATATQDPAARAALDRTLVNLGLEELELPFLTRAMHELLPTSERARFDAALAQAPQSVAAKGYLARTIEGLREAASTPAPAPVASLPPPDQAQATKAGSHPQHARATDLLPRHGGGVQPAPVMRDATERAPTAPVRVAAPVAHFPGRANPSRDEPESARDQPSFHVYGGKAALTIEAGQTPKSAEATVFVDIAPARAQKSYAWDRKIRWMFTPAELYAALAVVVGCLKQVRFANHGEDAKKWMEIEHQGANLFVKVGDGEAMHALPVYAPDAAKISAILLRQLRANTYGMSDAALLSLVRQQYAPMHEAQRAPRNRARAAAS
jgi:hypothetical protein